MLTEILHFTTSKSQPKTRYCTNAYLLSGTINKIIKDSQILGIGTMDKISSNNWKKILSKSSKFKR